MKAGLLAVVLLATPAVAYAHSGTVLKIAVNYIPILLALVPIFWTPIERGLSRVRRFFKKEDK